MHMNMRRYAPTPPHYCLLQLRLSAVLAICILSTTAVIAQVALPSINRFAPCTDHNSGIVVTSVQKDSDGEKAGIREGDVILTWGRANANREIRSPFDLSETEVEQEPLGPIMLRGERSDGTQQWTLGPDKWGIETRPSLPEGILRIFEQGEELARLNKLELAVRRWEAAAKEAESYRCSWLNSWFHFHIAEKLIQTSQWKNADAQYQEAIDALAGPESETKAQIYRAWASSFTQRGDSSTAEKYLNQALAENQKAGAESLPVAIDISVLGSTAYNGGDLSRAEDYFRRALAIRQKLAPTSRAVAVSLNNLGNVEDDRGELEAALEDYRQALLIKKKLNPDSIDLAATLNNIAIVQDERGELEEAAEYHKQALAIRDKLEPESAEVAESLNNLGNVAYDRADFAMAEDYYRKSLAIKEKVRPDSVSLAMTLGSLGNVAGRRGDLANAELYFHRSLLIMQKLEPDSLDVAAVLSNLGIAEHDRGDLDLAEKYDLHALAIKEKLDPNSLNLASTLENLGDVAYARHNVSKASLYYGQALEIRTKLAPSGPDMAASLRDVALIARDSGDLDTSEKKYRQAADIERRLAPDGEGYAESLAAMASVLRNRNQLDDGAKLYAEAIEVMDRQMTHLGGSSDVRAGFRSKHADYYTEYVSLLLEQNKPEIAFRVLEQSRARTLLETLAQGHVDVHQGVAPGTLEKERLLQAALAVKMNRRISLLQTEHTAAQLATINKDIDEAIAQYKDLKDQILSSNPRYASLTQPKTLSAGEVQQQLLDADTVLLDYVLGAERSYVFVVTPDSLDSYSLPKESEIEKTARPVYDLLTLRSHRLAGETSEQRQARLAKQTAEYQAAVAALARTVLEPVARQIKGKRLLIVADGALQYIPFTILPISSEDSAEEVTPLLAEHEVVNLPSASVLAVLRQQAAQRTSKPTKEVAVLADPVFDRNDPRVNAKNTATVTQTASMAKTEPAVDSPQAPSGHSLTRSLEDVRGAGQTSGGLPRLVFSRREAAAIMSATKTGEGMEAVDFVASRDTAMNKDLSRYKIVHFATHGLLDNEHPELSGLVLSMVGEDGKPRNGFLDLEDIYNLELPADLVVLSACETGLGKEISGEGLVGLTRGFMYAGASRVVASLWEVDDAATAELMGAFYRAMLKDGLRPVAALRQAQLELRKQKRWHDPYYWAGFTLQGEWK